MKMETFTKIAFIALLCVMLTGVAAAADPYDVTVEDGEQVTVTATSSSTYNVDETTDLGALELASNQYNFSYNISDAWYQNYSSFYLVDLDGYSDDYANNKAWFIWINDDYATSGLGLNDLEDNDMVKFKYCPYNTTTWLPYEDDAEHEVKIKVEVE